MPTYEYACKSCGEHLEAVQSFKDDALTECPNCGGPLRKVYGNVGIAFKGSGFYKNDSRATKSSSSPAQSKDRPSESSSGDSGSSSTPASSGDSAGSSGTSPSGSSDKSGGSSGSGGSGGSSGSSDKKAAATTSS